MSASIHGVREIPPAVVVHHTHTGVDPRINRLEREIHTAHRVYERGVQDIRRNVALLVADNIRRDRREIIEEMQRRTNERTKEIDKIAKQLDEAAKEVDETAKEVSKLRKNTNEFVKRSDERVEKLNKLCATIGGPSDALPNFPDTPAGKDEELTVKMLRGIRDNVSEAKKIFTFDISIGRFFIHLIKIGVGYALLTCHHVCVLFGCMWD